MHMYVCTYKYAAIQQAIHRHRDTNILENISILGMYIRVYVCYVCV